MKMKTTLYRELISLIIVILGIIFISLGLLLPKLLMPIYEKNIYQYLKQPLSIIGNDLTNSDYNDIAYIYIVDNNVVVSENIKEVITLESKQILENIKSEYGNFKYSGRSYYYYVVSENNIKKIAIINNDFILEIRSDIMKTLLPTLLITLLISMGMIIIWARNLVVKIELLKDKVDNLANDEYVDRFNSSVNDELYSLSEAIDGMKEKLKKEEEYKNQMYQNISHDFKTPLTVIKSHIEADEDGILDHQTCHNIIKQQINKLEAKVHSLLYLNKLAYIKEIDYSSNEIVDIKPIIESAIEKFKIQRTDVEFKFNINGKTTFRGTFDMWEAIIDNLLNNFLRYANKQIKINVKNHKITFYNDGPNIDDKIFNDLFTPYKKGINGQFGLGLSIVKKTLNLLNYEINVENENNGVIFTIK